jgi:hypothetical protein
MAQIRGKLPGMKNMIMRRLELNWILQFRNLHLAQESNPSIEGQRGSGVVRPCQTNAEKACGDRSIKLGRHVA